MAHDLFHSGSGGAAHQLVEHGMLQTTLEGAAAHDPQIDVHHVALDVADHGGNQAVVAELVHQAAVKGDVSRIGHDALHLGGGVAAGGQVELVGLVDQLGDALGMGLVKGADLTVHLQALQIVVVIAEALLQLSALQILLVHAGALLVVRREGGHLKVAAAVDGRDVLFRRAQLGHGHARQLLAHDLPLGGVVVHENEAFRQDVDLLGHGRDVPALGFPVGLEAEEVVPLEYGVRPLEAGQSDFLLVLAAHIQKNAQLGQLF